MPTTLADIAHTPRNQTITTGITIIMSNLSVLAFETKEVRFVGTPEKPEWIAADVCAILGIDTSLAVNGRIRKSRDGKTHRDGGLDSDERGTAIVSTPGERARNADRN